MVEHKAYWIATQGDHNEMVSGVLVVDYADPRGFRMRAKL
jgi:hypothetical protein